MCIRDSRSDEAARLGVTTAQIAETLRVATIGDVDAALAKISLDNRQIPVRVRLSDASRQDLNRIAALRVPTNRGISVPLSAVADIAISQGPATVERLNRERSATIGANRPVGVALGTCLLYTSSAPLAMPPLSPSWNPAPSPCPLAAMSGLAILAPSSTPTKSCARSRG